MSKFGKVSLERLATCHPDLQKVFNKVIENVDCTIICGHRGEEEQNDAYRTGKSKEKWPNSKHNSSPSMAVDAAPFPIDWNDRSRFYYFAGYVLATAHSLGVKLRLGADWDGDFDLKDQNFYDLPHFELKD